MAGSGRGQRRGERERERASHVYGDLNYNILGPNLDLACEIRGKDRHWTRAVVR